MSLFDEVLFPRRCPLCGEIVTPSGELICPGCLKRLPRLDRVCPGCGREITSQEQGICKDCRKEQPYLSGCISGYRLSDSQMAGTVKNIAENHAFDRMDGLVVDFSIRFRQTMDVWNPDCLIPLPPHALIQLPGENPDEAFAIRLARLLNLPIRRDLLKRGGVKKAAAVPRRILLCTVRTVDRETAALAASALRTAGAEAVFLASLTAGPADSAPKKTGKSKKVF